MIRFSRPLNSDVVQKLTAYLKQLFAEYTNFINPAKAQELQLSALGYNSRLLKSIVGATYNKLSAPAAGQAVAATNFMEIFLEGNYSGPLILHSRSPRELCDRGLIHNSDTLDLLCFHIFLCFLYTLNDRLRIPVGTPQSFPGCDKKSDVRNLAALAAIFICASRTDQLWRPEDESNVRPTP